MVNMRSMITFTRNYYHYLDVIQTFLWKCNRIFVSLSRLLLLQLVVGGFCFIYYCRDMMSMSTQLNGTVFSIQLTKASSTHCITLLPRHCCYSQTQNQIGYISSSTTATNKSTAYIQCAYGFCIAQTLNVFVRLQSYKLCIKSILLA